MEENIPLRGKTEITLKGMLHARIVGIPILSGMIDKTDSGLYGKKRGAERLAARLSFIR